MNRRYVILYGRQGHPLANAKGELLEHRAVLLEKIGPGSHPCHFCGRLLTWRKRKAGTGWKVTDLQVEHLDGDGTNNDPDNLEPCCQPCNSTSGFRSDRIQPDELVVPKSGGHTTRATKRICAQCGSEFLAAVSDPQRFCSRHCANDGNVRDVCKRGHPRSGANLNKYGQCRECNRIAWQKYRAKQRGASA